MFRLAGIATLVALLGAAGAQTPAATVSLWVLQPPDRSVEYDLATWAERRSVPVPPRVFERPEYLTVNAKGQLLFSVPAGVGFGGGEIARTADLVWVWDGRATREWPRETTPPRDGSPSSETTQRWFLSAGGDALYAFESRFAIDRDRDGPERSVRTATTLWRTDLTGANRQVALALPDLPTCECTTGVCSESCPRWELWAPDGVVDRFLLVTRFTEGQLQTEYHDSRLYRRVGQKWGPAPSLPDAIEFALDGSADGNVLVTAVYDAGCCGWVNESSDRLLVLRDGKTQVVYDEWTRYNNPDYDVSFFARNARIAPDRGQLAYTVVADALQDGELRLSSDGKENPTERERVRRTIAELPVVEVVPFIGTTREPATIPHAELVGWINDREILAAQDGRLVVYDVRGGGKRRDTPIRVRSAADAFLR